jgi:hypothetical protein
MLPSEKGIDWILNQLEDHSTRKHSLLHPRGCATGVSEPEPSATFLRLLQRELEQTARHERLQQLLQAVGRFAAALRLQGD